MAEAQCLAHDKYSVHSRNYYHYSYLCLSLFVSFLLSLSHPTPISLFLPPSFPPSSGFL